MLVTEQLNYETILTTDILAMKGIMTGIVLIRQRHQTQVEVAL